MNRAIFLDRDGVLDELVFYPDANEWEGPRRVEDVRMMVGVREQLERARDAGWLLFIVTNQPNVAKQKATADDIEAVQAKIVAGLPIAKSYLCFHHPDAIDETMRACECRKPGTKSLRDAAREFGVDLAGSWMVGDQDSDLLAGRAAGCRVALVENPHSAHKRGKVEPDLRVTGLADFIARVVDTRPP